jgi:hypothetical protein
MAPWGLRCNIPPSNMWSNKAIHCVCQLTCPFRLCSPTGTGDLLCHRCATCHINPSVLDLLGVWSLCREALCGISACERWKCSSLRRWSKPHTISNFDCATISLREYCRNTSGRGEIRHQRT